MNVAIFEPLFRVILVLAFSTEFALASSGQEEFLNRCDITAKQDQTGSVAIYSKAVKKKTIVEKTVRNLTDVEW